ncbi:Regulatory protein, GntR:Bacterial regulatory protein, GntR [Mesorhizobium sp. SOD10]|nr:Regulatory protein, GntR:Bacterial regulatory protein, GntR [Mesorhizobium sp. SOD10]
MPKYIAREIARSLRNRIDAGEWSESGRLPNERELATQYRVARNTMRSAIDRLAGDGTLVRHVGRGTFLRQDNRGSILKMLHRLSGASPIDVMAVRLILEPRATALAAINANANELRAIAAAYGSSVAALEMEDFERWDAELHLKIVRGTRNELLTHLHEVLCVVARTQEQWRKIKQRTFSMERRHIYCRQHGEIVEALMRRDGEAAATAMRGHLETVRQNLFAGNAL